MESKEKQIMEPYSIGKFCPWSHVFSFFGDEKKSSPADLPEWNFPNELVNLE